MKIDPTGSELFHEDERKDRQTRRSLRSLFAILPTRQKKPPSINCNKARYWAIGILFPLDHWGVLGVDGWIILGWVSMRWDVGMWTGLRWPRIGTDGGRL